MHNYKELVVWQKSTNLVTDIYGLTSSFPSDERFGIISQMRRSAVSISSNIAEGCSRRSNKAFVNFLTMSMGSQYELETQLLISQNLKLADSREIDTHVQKLIEIQKMTHKLILKFSTDDEATLLSHV